MKLSLEQTELECPQIYNKRQTDFDQNIHGPGEQELADDPFKRQVIENGVQSQQIILYDGLLDTPPSKLNQKPQKLKVVTYTIIGVLFTILLVSIFFLFGAPYIPAIRDRMIQSEEGTIDVRKASNTAGTPCNQTNSQSVQGNSVAPIYANWKYFDQPQWFANFEYNVLDEVVFSFEKVIPKSSPAKQMKLKIFIRSWNESKHIDFWTRIKLVNRDDEFMHWIYTSVYPKDALIVTEETFIVPIENTRELRIMANYKKTSWLFCGIMIEAWR